MNHLILDNRSLTFSIVKLDSHCDSVEYYVTGIPDKYNIDATEGFQEFVESLNDDTEISISIRSYCVGRGESEYPSDEELEWIKMHEKQLEQLYGIDCIQCDGFTHFYELEEEY